jgi:hypothetical protein
MLKVTALKDIEVIVNQRMPQHSDPERGVGPSHEEVRRIAMRTGESRDDVVMVFGLVPSSAPADAEVGIIDGVGEVVAVTHPTRESPVAESFGVVRLEYF